MSHSINILSLSNDPQLAAVVQHRLEDEQIDVNMQTVDNRHAYQVALAGNHFDVILVDGTQDAVDGIEAIETAKRHSLDIPVIMLSDTLDEAMIVMAIKRGASDYVLKRNIEHIDTLIRQSLDECQMGYLGAAESRVNDAMETRYQDIVNSLPGAVYQFQKNIDGSYSFPCVSTQFEQLAGIPAGDVHDNADEVFKQIYPVDLQTVLDSIEASALAMTKWELEFRIFKANGELAWVQGISTPRKQQDGSILWSGILLDITRQKQTETALKKSEMSVQGILQTLIETYYRTNMDGQIIVVSPSARQLLGYSQEELIGRKLSEFYFDARGRENFLKALESNNGIITGYEAALKHKKGHLVWVATSARYYFDEDGNIAGIEGITRDITAKHEIEMQRQDDLEITHERLNLLLASMPTVLYSLDVIDGKIMPNWISENICNSTGFTTAEAMQASWWFDNVHPDDMQLAHDNLNVMFATGTLSHEYRIRRKDGEYIWVLDRLELIRDEAGRAVRINGSWNDITERKIIENALRVSEERFVRSQQFANIGTWDWNIQSGDLHWSDRIAPLFGYPEGNLETTYENFLAAVHPDDRQVVIDAVNACVESGAEYNIEHRVVWPDGTVRWLLETGDVTRADDGSPLHMLGVVQDIHERKMAQQALETSEALLKDAQKMANMGHWSLDIASGELIWSDEIYRIFGYLPDEFEPSYQRFFDAVHPDDVEAIKRSENEAYENNAKHSIDHRIILPDGSVRWVHEEAKTEYDKHGKAVRLSGTVQDITERKLAEDALLVAKEEAEMANRAKSEFLSSMSHELRTPLNAIIGFSQLLESDIGLTAEQIENAKEIHHAGHHLLELINDVLDLSKIESGHIAVQNQTVSIDDILTECQILIASLAAKNNVSLTSACRESPKGLFVKADPVRLKQSILNLLSNAVKYNVPGGNVHIYTSMKDDGIVRISIEDTGKGISKDKIGDLFTPFERLGYENSGIEGSGIGLVITRKLVELMGGVLEVESKEDGGSIFSFTLNMVESETKESKALQILPSDIEMQSSGKKIIYIEDNPANLKLVEKIIRRLDGVILVSAVEPVTGIELVKDHVPDLILLDINLPGMSGYDVIKAIRENTETSLIPVIAVSANAMESDITQSKQAGFDDYITKPINIMQFREIVGRYI